MVAQVTRAPAALPRGMLNPLQPARTPALSDGAGSAGSRAGCSASVRGASQSSPKTILGPIWDSPEGLEGQLSVFGAPFSVQLGAPESSIASDRAKLYAKSVFLGVGGSGRRPSRMCNLLRERGAGGLLYSGAEHWLLAWFPAS